MNFYIEKAIQDAAPRTRLGVVLVDGATVEFGHPRLDDMRLRVVNRVKDAVPTIGDIKGTPQIAGLDQLLERFHPDTGRRSTVEGLLRTVLEGGPVPVENDAVDVTLLLSLYYFLPVFAVDRREIRGNVGLTVGRYTRRFEVTQGLEPLASEGRVFLGDDAGYFASPIATGKRAIVSERTSEILLVALFPENVGDSIVRDFIRRGGNWLTALCGGEVTGEGMVGEAEALAE